MNDSKWSYHFGSIDGFTRSGELRYGEQRFRLPVILDPSDPDGRYGIIPHSWEWEGIGMGLMDIDPPEEVPDILENAHREALIDLDARSLSPIVTSSKTGLFGGYDGNMDRIPAYVLPYFRMVMSDPRKAAKALTTLTLDDPLHMPLFLPGVADSGNLETLFYLGIEIFDTLSARRDGMMGLYHTDTGPISYERLTRTGRMLLSCGCSGCMELAEMPSPVEARKPIIAHNVEQMRRRMAVACLALQEGRLRELVMGRLAGNPVWMSAIRSVEGNADPRLQAMTPSFRAVDSVKITYRDDLNAPDLAGWRRSILGSYRPIEGRSVLLLLPCSQKKPYSTSRTHQRIRDALRGVKGWRMEVQQVVITSPLGAVPMELEDLFPASYYDIPVTGEWFPEELQMTREMVEHIFRSGSYQHVVCFHKEGVEFFPEGLSERIFPGASFVNIYSIADENGDDPYAALSRTLRDLVLPAKRGNYEVEELLSLVRFSLGVDLSPLSGIEVRWSRRGREIRVGKDPLMIFGKGGPVPTLLGGRTIWDLKGELQGKRVIIEDFVPKGTVFSQGITDTMGMIRSGDIVLVGTDGEYRGVGRALVPDVMMKKKIHGPAVKMLHGIR
ncbi:MAG: DUF5591 domain-containing protein [Candidatus Thermoplasmatota archaeon]|nr:DUF5591 domain-containing protein [Candidatus Thermoplasmatota archaeon]